MSRPVLCPIRASRGTGAGWREERDFYAQIRLSPLQRLGSNSQRQNWLINQQNLEDALAWQAFFIGPPGDANNGLLVPPFESVCDGQTNQLADSPA